MRPGIVAAGRILTGATLLLSGVSKTLAPAAFLASMQAYPAAAHVPVIPVAALLPWGEVFLGFCLFVGILPRGASLWAGLLLLAYTGALAQRAIATPHEGSWLTLSLDCGCGFGAVQVSVKLVENLLLIGLCGAAVTAREDRGVLVQLS